MVETMNESLKSVPDLLETGKPKPKNSYIILLLNYLYCTYIDCFQL